MKGKAAENFYCEESLFWKRAEENNTLAHNVIGVDVYCELVAGGGQM